MRKIYYVPGLISALLIPVLFWYYGSQRIHPVYSIIDLGLPAKVIPQTSLDNTFEPYRNWNYKKIIVKPNTAFQNRDFYVSELKELQAKNEKETGIEFVIENQNTYRDFIALIDAMILSKQEAYCVDLEKTGHFFAVHFYKDPSQIERGYDVVGGEYHYDNRPSYRGFEKIKYLLELPKQAYYIIFGLLLFVNISMLSIKERLLLSKRNYTFH
ncbi:hypothetical protein C1637_23600 [Chryseobacterium lactis]|uniref:Uncharacterized protein n=1 Tax=Chryseobacterium lactis TaxID=1241981 RepID=A0A3G6RDP1_CHRLC|nr:hypothetical protein [Chryseobacterium lactis]AZA82819.1 hypothetical protein EG342_13465 [Chryseobacterium lactis]AZB03201.1 hypothetical protein EG341_04330 [Chryseobacterium lactis]PNW11270.1 hypothetical protein C1637_23600 [Chryseobacterium lactis]